MRIARKPFRADPYFVEQLLRHLPCLGKGVAHAQARIDGKFGMLADQLHRTDAAPGKRGAVAEHLAHPRTLVAGEDSAQRRFAESRGGFQGHALPRRNGKLHVAK